MKKGKANPYDARYDKVKRKAFENTEKSVKPVAKDTNKTRRKNTLEPLKNANKKRKPPRPEKGKY